MASSKTVIVNLALSHLGSGKEIADLETEQSDEASAMRRFYDEARDKALRDFNWPFATKIASLALVETNPNDEWTYSYRYPTDCLNIRRILSGVRTDNRQTRAAYKVAKDSAGRIIFTDIDIAKVEYTERVETVEIYPPDFVMALSYLMAMYTAPRVTGGDPFGLGKKSSELYLQELSNARSNAFNEEQVDQPAESELYRARDGIFDPTRRRGDW